MDFQHPYLPLTERLEEEMLKSIQKDSIESLFGDIPKKFRINGDLALPTDHSEYEVARRLEELAQKNTPADSGRVFLGAGVDLHYIPAAVRELATRSEFVTAYTSYQPEISQGMLQTLFEYQSLLAEILEIDVVNSSMYDRSTALGEAARMAARVKRNRTKFLVPSTIDPAELGALHTYCEPLGIDIVRIDFDPSTGLMSLTDLESKLDTSVAGVYIENPSYLGFIESQVDQIEHIVHEAGALLIAGVDIISLGLLRPPGNYGADIVIGEGQPLGSHVSFGGPLLGIFGCRNDMKLIRQLPGRLVGMTRTREEPYERGFVLTLSPREQHIKREKATSNICSNQALSAVTAAIYMALLGPTGLRQLSETIAYKSNYAAKKLNEIPGVTAPAIGTHIWKDFVVRFDNGITAEDTHRFLLNHGIHGGRIIKNDFPTLGEAMLFSVTEIHTKETIDTVAELLATFSKGGVSK